MPAIKPRAGVGDTGSQRNVRAAVGCGDARSKRQSPKLQGPPVSARLSARLAELRLLRSNRALGRPSPEGDGFQQAKNAAPEPQFVPIVAKPKRPARKKPEPKLTRVAFKVSRLMEFCSERELQNQTGHSIYEWPLVVAKELLDNALDACEEAEVAPKVAVTVGPGT